MRRKSKVIIISLTLVLSVVTILAIILVPTIVRGEEIDTNINTTESTEIKYSKPEIGDIANEGSYPDEKSSEDSNIKIDKEWYEYIIYNETPLDEFITSDGKFKIVYYDPYDYSYGMVMELGRTAIAEILEGGDKYYQPTGTFTTANQITIGYTYTHSQAYSESDTWDIGGEITTSLEYGKFLGAAKATVEVKAGVKYVYGDVDTWQDDTTRSIEQTFDAVHFNPNTNVPYSWRVVTYTVYLPMHLEVYKKVNGTWSFDNNSYLLLKTIQGTCREWIQDGITYYEDWATGEPITKDDFWKSYLSAEDIKKAYENALMPKIEEH